MTQRRSHGTPSSPRSLRTTFGQNLAGADEVRIEFIGPHATDAKVAKVGSVIPNALGDSLAHAQLCSTLNIGVHGLARKSDGDSG